MDVFELRNNLIEDYSSFVESFINIRDERISDHVQSELKKGALWPEPLVQLNPCFEPGETIDELVDSGILCNECRNIFRVKTESDSEGKLLRLHSHQAEAVRIAAGGHSYVLTTGTGSGKSLSYIIPIADHVLRNGSGKGVRGIIVYPMNALANSQLGELEKFICYGYPDNHGPVTFRRYTGQESDDEKNKIIADPPDILLTNYVMLELILTRPQEKNLIQAAQNLRFLVLDELHTYRGRQGADVAMLVRRAREAFSADNMQCVGTSATLAGGGTWREQQEEVAKVVSLLFGADIKPEHIVGETLRRITPEEDIQSTTFINRLSERLKNSKRQPPSDFESFIKDPLSIWIESTLGIQREVDTGKLVRQAPCSITGSTGIAHQLSELTGVEEQECIQAINRNLLSGYHCIDPKANLPVFAFKLHQFISRGDTVYASLEKESERYITLHGLKVAPGDNKKPLLPVAFCRECGQEYYCVWREQDENGTWQYSPRDYTERIGEENSEAGFLYTNTEFPWPSEESELFMRIPEDWFDEHRRVLQNRRKYVPQLVNVDANGKEHDRGLQCCYFTVPFRFCLRCGVSFGFRQRSDFHKVTALGSEGRSTATTILSLSTIRNLRQMPLEATAKKLLSFTDNRQDASLQAGHFNDYIEVGLLRSALYLAVSDAAKDGLRHEEITQRVFDKLTLPFESYASDPSLRGWAKEETNRVLRDVLGYRLYRDLQRGWRIMAPNLEQVGLLQIDYPYLTEACEDNELWNNCHVALSSASIDTRRRISKALLDFMRREVAIKIDYLNSIYQERLIQQSRQRLIPPWGLDESSQVRNMLQSSILYPRSRQRGDFRGNVYLSSRSGFGQYIRRSSTFENHGDRITLPEADLIIRQLLNCLRTYGLVEVVKEPSDESEVPGYQLVADAMLWRVGDGDKGYYDPISRPTESVEGSRANPFFVNHYRSVANDTLGIEGREHTAQVPYDEREKREEKFREGTLPILFCSPTMELGIDIAQLNAVNMRNVPPTPANYAQRSGRAGRSGQPALVFTYCAGGSPHDQYFFRRPTLMVAGAVSPPQIDLTNEDLIKAHIHSIWLAETGLYLGASLKEVLDVNGDNPTLALLEHVSDAVQAELAKRKAKESANHILETIKKEIESSDWYSESWLSEVLTHIPISFEQACERWRGLYIAALKQAQNQDQIIRDATRAPADKTQAQRLRRDAEAQLRLLTENENLIQSDFYSYRYFASEGFLPGYNFPRLPLSAYIPGRQIRGSRDEFLSRPRFLAISEFGPRSIVYHEGSHYIINQVILPVQDSDELQTRSTKICQVCGYLHPIIGSQGPDLCEMCGAALGAPLGKLFRLQNVVTKRRDRISCDEEDRLRLGYEVKTVVRFAERGGQPSYRVAILEKDEEPFARLLYGNAATLWRINMGRARRRNRAQLGFLLDVERGYWARNEDEADDASDPMSPRKERVIPYVEDRRNCLALEFSEKFGIAVMASLQAAIKNAIQYLYELEDSELAAEPLPEKENRRSILIYEAAEGGAGVLRRIIDDPKAICRVAERALLLCHFEAETGNDLRRSEYSDEDCEAACYDCLMSYRNQTDHNLLDRHLIRDVLLELSKTEARTSPAPKPRSEHLENLIRLAGSKLEKQWLDFIEINNYRLPSDAQKFMEDYQTRPDFLYKEKQAVIYVDGPPHDYPERAERDKKQTELLEDAGWTVIRFGHDDDWGDIVDRYPNIFGGSS